MNKNAAVLLVALLPCTLVACVSDDTVQESVDGGYFPSDAAPYDATISEDAGEDATTTDAADAAVVHNDASSDASAHDGSTDASDSGSLDATPDAAIDGAAGLDSGDDASD